MATFQIKLKTNINKMMNKVKENLIKEVDTRVLRAFQMASKEIVEWAKTNHGYTQQTGNLNASTGFNLYKDGDLINTSFGSSRLEGDTIGAQVAAERESELSGSYRIATIVVAGMNYAIHVENMGFDVLAGAELRFPDVLTKWLQKAFEGTGISAMVE